MRKNRTMRILSLGGLLAVVLILLVSNVFAIESGSVTVPQRFYDTTAVPQIYTYVLRQTAGQTQVVVPFQSGISSFESVTTNAPYSLGTITLTHYKLSREPINKFALAKRTYEYITLESNTTIKSTDGVNAQIVFSVDKSWVANVGGSASQMALYIFDTDWKKLDTTLLSSDGNKYEYSAYTNDFGYFAIALDRPLQDSATTSATSTGSVQQSSASSSSNIDQSTTSSATNSASGPQVVDTTANSPVDVVYPLLDNQNSSDTSSSNMWQRLIGYGLLLFAISGIGIVSVTVVQSRRSRPVQYKSSTSVNELLAKLQASRVSKAPKMSSDINALLQKVHARYQPTFSVSRGISATSAFPAGTSAFANSLSHSIDELKSKVAQLEPDLITRYADWGLRQGHDIMTIKQDLLAHDVDESVINRVLANHWK